MSIKEGQKLPLTGLKKLGDSGPEDIDMTSYFSGRKVVLFSVPGAFTPTCSAKHLPGFIAQADVIKAKGVDAIACVAVNDAFVMKAWGEDQNVGDRVDMLADGSSVFTSQLGLGLDLESLGLGMRGERFAMIVEDGTVTHLAVEAPGAFEVSSAEAILKQL